MDRCICGVHEGTIPPSAWWTSGKIEYFNRRPRINLITSKNKTGVSTITKMVKKKMHHMGDVGVMGKRQ
jgi:hypothetical protein